MRRVKRSPDLDPASAVAQPVTRALDSLIVGAAAAFGLSIAAVILAIGVPDGPIHDYGHLGLFVVMGVAVLARAVHIVRRRSEPNPDAWSHAQRLHGTDAVLARALTVSVPLAWLAGAVTILAHHEVVVHPAVPLMAGMLPVAATVWILASLSWHDFCRDRIGLALEESDRRYRAYWKDLGARP
jgi:hypothetical protein